MSPSEIREIRAGLYRATTYVDKLNLGFSQFFIRGDGEGAGDVVCVETGTRAHFPALAASLARAGLSPERVTDVVVPHFEVDEMGALPEFLAANPALTAHAHPVCAHALADVFGVHAQPLRDREPATLAGVEIVPIFAKHVHQWDSLVVYLPGYKALLSSDVFMRYGTDAQPDDDPLAGIVMSLERSDFLPSLAHLATVLRKLQALDIELLLPMHGPAIERDVPGVIAGLIGYCERAARVV
jgi:flavorubredoxin